MTATTTRRNSSAAADVPVIDIGAIRSDRLGACAALLARSIADACEHTGFLVISGHGVPDDVVSRAYAATRTFFHLPYDKKMTYLAQPDDPLMRGYGRKGNLAAGAGTGSLGLPDLSETFTYNRLGDDPTTGLPADDVHGIATPNRWPAVEGFERAYREYYAEMESLAAAMMELFALGLGLPRDWFEVSTRDHMTNLTANYYPPQIVPPMEGQLRKGMHSDWGALTILYQDSDIGGLQVLDRSGDWFDVPAIPGTFVVNIGDLMARWTNDQWVSTVHRVVNPPVEQANSERYSLPFFFQPTYDHVIECIPTCIGDRPLYSPTTSGDYLLRRLGAAYGT